MGLGVEMHARFEPVQEQRHDSTYVIEEAAAQKRLRPDAQVSTGEQEEQGAQTLGEKEGNSLLHRRREPIQHCQRTLASCWSSLAMLRRKKLPNLYLAEMYSSFTELSRQNGRQRAHETWVICIGVANFPQHNDSQEVCHDARSFSHQMSGGSCAPQARPAVNTGTYDGLSAEGLTKLDAFSWDSHTALA